MFIAHERPLVEGRLLARYDRFIATIELGSGEVIEAHCVNPGRMEGMVVPGAKAWVSRAPEGTKRKLLYTLELLFIGGHYIGANTVVPNRLGEALVRAGKIPGLKRFSSLRREVRYGTNSRVDLLLQCGAIEHLVEIKNCHLVYPDGGAYFPDSVSVRAAGHLEELSNEVRAGRKATVLFIIQRADGEFLRPSRLHDPAFADAVQAAAKAGVRFKAAKVEPRPDGFHFIGLIPVDLKPDDTEPLRAYRDALLPDSGWIRRGRKRALA